MSARLVTLEAKRAEPIDATPRVWPLRWLEIAADHRCNHRCLGCPVEEAGPSLGAGRLVQALEDGRRLGIDRLWIGGGEPTLRRDLLPFVREARARGYTRIKLQTNGALLSYADTVDRLAAAGVTEVALSIQGGDTGDHDRLSRAPGAFDRLLRAVENVRARNLPVEGDVLVYRSTTASLPAIVRRFFELGVPRFRVWMMAPGDDAGARDEEPRLADVARAVAATLALRLSDAPDHVVSLHTPPCLLPGDAARARFFAPELGLLVTDAGGSSFRLEESPIEGGYFPPPCTGCALRARCGGVRRTYVARHGDRELQPQSTP